MTRTPGHLLRGVVLVLAGCGLVLPVLAGLFETAAMAGGGPGGWAGALERLAALPGVGRSVVLTLTTGLMSTAVALGLAFAAVQGIHRHGLAGSLGLAPVLASPHAAVAIGLGFLIAPSGWLVRLVHAATGRDGAPPDWASVNDPLGLALTFGLVVKELPFLLLVMLAALDRLPLHALVAAARSAGYSTGQAWLRVVLPELYPLVRPAVLVVLAFALSVVDMALILGPGNPPTLAIAMTRWFQAGDLSMRQPAAAAALVLATLVVAAVVAWLVCERVVGVVGRRALQRGRRGGAAATLGRAAGAVLQLMAHLALAGGVLSILALAAWSMAGRWSFPDALPEAWSADAWVRQAGRWQDVALQSLWIAAASTALSMILAVLWLEGESRGGFRRARWAQALVYLPLMVPQTAFLFGLHVAWLRPGLAGSTAAVIWAHVLFVFPYVMLSLSEPWHRFDRRLLATAAALGADANARLLRLRIPCLTAPLLTAAAVGFAVSMAQYLPTLTIGAGRVATLTTEAVALASGGDRRVAGVFAFLQAALPVAVYALALGLPWLVFANRRGLLARGAAP